jgi:hypothetical protein
MLLIGSPCVDVDAMRLPPDGSGFSPSWSKTFEQFGRRPRIDEYDNVTYLGARGITHGTASPAIEAHVVDALRVSRLSRRSARSYGMVSAVGSNDGGRPRGPSGPSRSGM